MSRYRTETLEVALPSGFDPSRHQDKLLHIVSQKHGSGWEIDHIDPVAATATVIRQATLAEVTDGDNDKFKQVKLPRGTKPADGDKTATKLESQYEGFYLTSFEPYLGWATLKQLTDNEVRARGALAVALGVKPWDIQISSRADGGFNFTLPKTYVPSKHDDRLDEVAESVVGKPGWVVQADAQKLTGSLIPADPPTFPKLVPYPFNQKIPALDLASGEWARIPIGEKLGPVGGKRGKPLITDFIANPMMQISGITGGGKGVLLTSLLAGALARGWQVGLVDAVKGGVDFVDLVPFCRPGFFADDLEQACTVLAMAYEEGQRRKALIKEHRVQKVTQLPKSLNIHPLMIVVDEATSLLMTSPIPKGIDKDSALAVEITNRNTLMASSLEWMGKIARELRFAGVSLVVSTQVASTSVGIPTEMRSNLGAKFLLGSSPTKNNRRLALTQPDVVPEVPHNIASDTSGAAAGVGVFEREGDAPGVFKAYFSKPTEFGDWLNRLHIPTTDRPNPTAKQIAEYTPSLKEAEEEGEPPSRYVETDAGFGRNDKPAPRQDGLTGAAAAAHDARVEAASAAKRQ